MKIKIENLEIEFDNKDVKSKSPIKKDIDLAMLLPILAMIDKEIEKDKQKSVKPDKKEQSLSFLDILDGLLATPTDKTKSAEKPTEKETK